MEIKFELGKLNNQKALEVPGFNTRINFCFLADLGFAKRFSAFHRGFHFGLHAIASHQVV